MEKITWAMISYFMVWYILYQYFPKSEMQWDAFAKKDSILLSQSSWCDDKRNQKVLVWGKHELSHLRKHKKLDCHVDTTFKPTPKEFY